MEPERGAHQAGDLAGDLRGAALGGEGDGAGDTLGTHQDADCGSHGVWKLETWECSSAVDGLRRRNGIEALKRAGGEERVTWCRYARGSLRGAHSHAHRRPCRPKPLRRAASVASGNEQAQ